MSDTIYVQALRHLSAIQSARKANVYDDVIDACRSAHAWLETDVWDLENHDDFIEYAAVSDALETVSRSASRLFRAYAAVTTVLRDLIEGRP